MPQVWVIPTPLTQGTIRTFSGNVLLTACRTECREVCREAVVQWVHSRRLNRFRQVSAGKDSRLICRYLLTTRRGMGLITTRTPDFSHRDGKEHERGIVACVILLGINQGCSVENRNVVGFYSFAVFNTC